MRTPLLVLLAVLVLGGGIVAYALLQPTYPEVAELSLDTDWSFQELLTYFRELSEDKGAVYAFEVLKRAPLPPDTDPHLIGHIIGNVLYQQKGVDGIALCTDDFRNACSHSVVIDILSEHGEGSLPLIAETCRKAPGGNGAYTMCYHGLGHGVLAYVGYDLEAAVRMCERTGTSAYGGREYEECVGGTIMEMIAGVHDPIAWQQQFDRYFRAEDPLYPCNATFMTETVRGMCYTYLTPHLFAAAGLAPAGSGPHEYQEAFSYCDAIPEGKSELRDACYGGFGKEFVSLAQDRDTRNVGAMDDEALSNIRAWCTQAGESDGEAACNEHALSSLFWGGESEPDAAFSFCELAKGEAQINCYRDLSLKIQYYLSDTVRGYELCKRLPQGFQVPCAGPRML